MTARCSSAYKPSALAKADRASGAVRGVIGHCLDVAHCAFAMLRTSVLRERLCTLSGYDLTDVHIARLGVLAGLHDLGKCCIGFQNRIRGLNPESGHVAEAIAAVAREPPVRAALGPIPSWCARPGEMMHAVIAHHGEPVSNDRITACIGDLRWQWRDAGDGYDPVAEVHALLAALLSVFPSAIEPATAFCASPAFQHTVAGLVMTADWMGSDTRWHPLAGPDNRPEQADALLAATTWEGWAAQGTGDVLGGRAARPLQRVLMSHPLDHLVIAEAPTGEGKTEAALLWASRLVSAGLVDGLYFAVPTRSAATELHDRVARSMGQAYPLLQGHVVRAVPGLVSTDPRDPAMPPTWALGSMRRVMGAPVAVGTIDQAMLSVLRVRHAWLRWWCLSRHLLVIDEAHASDAYMTTVVTALVDAHVAAGGYALLMSATLGETMAAKLTQRPRLTTNAATHRPYPLVSSETVCVPVASPRRKRVRPIVMPLTNCEIQAAEHALRGEAVLWIRSTVADALDDTRRLRATGVPTLLHHSRYADLDRRYLDEQVLGVIGMAGQRRGVVIVATQTCEQSPDIDADLLVTDACPADVMLQRMGRLGRHRLELVPEAWIIEPAASADLWSRYLQRTGERCGVPGQGWGWVYDPLPARATIDWLKGRPLITVPDDARCWVETATHADGLLTRAEEYGGDWVAAWKASYGRDTTDRAKADAGIVDRTRNYHLVLVDGRIPTRLGDPSVDVPVNGLISPFGQGQIDVLPMPGRWLIKAGIGPQATARVEGLDALGRTTLVVQDGGQLRVAYSAEGLHRA
jgi:CRISPR-associated endonuclease/helicase Cas3